MTRLLKTEFYKMIRMTSFWVISAIMAVLAFANTFVPCFSYKQSGSVGMLLGPSAFNYFTIFSQVISAYTIPLIFVTMFSVFDFSTGLIKDIIPKGFSRISIYFSKFIALIGSIITFSLISTIVSFVTCKIMLNGLNIPDFYTFQHDQIIQTLLILFGIIVYVSLTLLISTSIRSTGLAITVTILWVSFEGLLYSLINLFAHEILKLDDFIINPYTILGAMQESPDHFTRAAIVLSVYLVVTFALGAFLFKKRDIN